MAPRVKVTKEDIVRAAVDLVRKSGAHNLNARTVALELNCSTQPIFSNFETMKGLQLAVVEKADSLCREYISCEIEKGEFPPFKASGMAYIRFAKEEKELFKLLFMCDRDGKEITPYTDFNASIEIIMQANKISREKAELMHLEMWTCVHGIGTMLATSFLSLDHELISHMLSDIYMGLRKRHLSEENT